MCVYIYYTYIKYLYIYTHTHTHKPICMGFPHSSVGKESACNAGDPGSIPGYTYI